MYVGKPEVFNAPTVHLDEVETLAPGTTLLATNETSNVQSVEIRTNGAIAWGVQYHPEYPLREIAAIVRRIGLRLIDEGFFLDTKEIATFAGDLDALDRATDAAARFVQCLAVLRRDQPRELVDMLFQHLLEPEHRPGANDGWRLAPAWEGRRGGADGGIDVLRQRERRPCDHHAARGIRHVEVCGCGRRDPPSVDEIRQKCVVAHTVRYPRERAPL
jgi:hypothetical protein